MNSFFRLPMLLLVLGLFLGGCSSVDVLTDYDQTATFANYKTYAFYKTGIDRAQISDLDKRRILRAIEDEMALKGFVKSEDPDLLVSIFTTEKERVDVYNNVGWGYGWGGAWGWGYGPGWGWGPGWGYGWGPSVSTSTEGALYIDLIDTRQKELIWQGRGQGTLGNTSNIEKKEARIREFVSKIMEAYPPEIIASR
ncbi:DUF4136 domain-containing protein [Robiginitalea aurantiaca]|uniref:DUF4136 domain-containing protein n=1 Tax=Robiginitalea aurantiaca TaxID=3056915 RepID=A0ABT7WF95_9FLAO|nr:DUF4136 domain-containing protein [Robiginitalea aurantiaca]MDM9631582.1 DUF4136 domain-containing protein [Robiginitalea aurantiaca]